MNMSVGNTIRDVTQKIGTIISGDSTPEILDTLKKEHEEVAELLKKLTDSHGSAERKTLLAKIAASLVPHTKAEEAVLYDALIAKPDRQGQQDGQEGYFEHELASRMLEKLQSIDPGTVAFAAGAKVLKELVEHHVREEERNVWGDAKKQFSLDERKQMNARYLTAKTKLPKSPPPIMKTQPRAPVKAVAAKAAPSSKKVPARRSEKHANPTHPKP
jgi:hypothetical protein